LSETKVSINILAQLFRAKKMRSFFLANNAWQTTNRFGKFSIDFSLQKSGESIVGEIERQIFLPNAVCRQLFAWQKKVW